MATTPAPQIDPSALDTAGLSVLTAPKSVTNPRAGAIYDPAGFAAAAPVWIHPLVDGRYLMVSQRRWYGATASGTDPGAYSTYSEDRTPSWTIVDSSGGTALVPGANAALPISASIDPNSATVTAGASRPPQFLYLLHAVSINGAPNAVLQHHTAAPNGAVTLTGEEVLPLTTDTNGVTAVYDRGIQYATPYLLLYGQDLNGVPGVNAVQTVTITGHPSSGTWTLTHEPDPTTNLAYNASASAVQAALEALPSIGTGNVTVTTDTTGAIYTITFDGALGKQAIPTMLATSALIPSGSTSITVATTTAGKAPTTAGLVYRIRKPWARVGVNTQTPSPQVHAGVVGTQAGWEYFTGTGYSADATEAAPVGGLSTFGPMSFAQFRNQVIATTVDATKSGQFWTSASGQTFTPTGPAIPLGGGSGYLGGGVQLQPQLQAATSMVTGVAAFPYVIWSKLITGTSSSLSSVWSLFQV